mgnify:CR=1 FL=1
MNFLKNHENNLKFPKIYRALLLRVLRVGGRATAKMYSSISGHENYAEINRTHRELHFLSSLATQLAKLATGELGEIRKIFEKNTKYHENPDFSRKSWFFKVFFQGCADLVPGLLKLRASRQGPQLVPKHDRECPGAPEHSQQHPGATPHRLEPPQCPPSRLGAPHRPNKNLFFGGR